MYNDSYGWAIARKITRIRRRGAAGCATFLTKGGELRNFLAPL